MAYLNITMLEARCGVITQVQENTQIHLVQSANCLVDVRLECVRPSDLHANLAIFVDLVVD
jgi:hypothetical protein